MKKNYVLLVFALIPLFVFSQADVKDVKEVRYYGIDFTQVSIVGANESAYQFIDAFSTINQVIVNEYKKYDLRKAFKKDILSTNIDMINELNANISTKDLQMGNATAKELSLEQLAEIVERYEIPDTEGVGLVFIAKELNKSKARGIYYVVFFDIESREVIYSKEASGKAKGFGLRNFWANSVNGMLGSWKW